MYSEEIMHVILFAYPTYTYFVFLCTAVFLLQYHQGEFTSTENSSIELSGPIQLQIHIICFHQLPPKRFIF